MKNNKFHLNNLSLLLISLTIASFSISSSVYGQMGNDIKGSGNYREEPENVNFATTDTTKTLKIGDIPIVKDYDREKMNTDTVTGIKKGLYRTGYMSFMSLGFLPGSSKEFENLTPVSMKMSHGFITPGGFYTGIGVGIETFQPAIMPVFLDIRVFFTKGLVRPWINGTAGYAITLNREIYNTLWKGGEALGIGGGLSYLVSETSCISFFIGYRFQKLVSTETDYQGHETKMIAKYNRVEVRIGIIFH